MFVLSFLLSCPCLLPFSCRPLPSLLCVFWSLLCSFFPLFSLVLLLPPCCFVSSLPCLVSSSSSSSSSSLVVVCGAVVLVVLLGRCGCGVVRACPCRGVCGLLLWCVWVCVLWCVCVRAVVLVCAWCVCVSAVVFVCPRSPLISCPTDEGSDCVRGPVVAITALCRPSDRDPSVSSSGHVPPCIRMEHCEFYVPSPFRRMKKGQSRPFQPKPKPMYISGKALPRTNNGPLKNKSFKLFANISIHISSFLRLYFLGAARCKSNYI